MELREYLQVLRKWWWLITLSTAVAGIGSWWIVKDQPPVYQTSTTLMIGRALEEVDPNYTDFYTSERLAQTYSELVRRERILRATAAALGYEEQWRSLRSQVGVRLVAGTQLLEIAVTDTDPARAKQIADELARQLELAVTPDETDEQRFISSQVVSLRSKIEAAQAEIESLEISLGESFSARQIQETETQIISLRNQISTWQSTYAQYQLLLGESGVKELETIEFASVPTVPIGPDWMMQVVLAAVIGLALSVGAVFLLEYLDDSLKSPADVLRVTGLTTLGAITRISGGSPDEMLVAIRHPKSPISEAYRVMRTNLQFSSLDNPARVLVITSPNPKEGKSTTLANLAVVMAQAGKSVVIVDTDLRRPMLHKIFQVPNREGLTSVLLEEEPLLDGQLQETGIENLRILTSGPLPPNPSELLGSQRMRKLTDRLQQEADVVLLDTPPALPVTDAAVLATVADGVLIVTDAGSTGRSAARQAVENLQQVGASLLGVVVNRLSARGSGKYYYYYYYYYHYAQNGKGRRRRRGRSWLRFAAAVAGILLVAGLVGLAVLLGYV